MGLQPLAACESVSLLREPDAGDPHVRFDEREVETERLASPRHLSTPPFSSPVPFSSPRPVFIARFQRLPLVIRRPVRQPSRGARRDQFLLHTPHASCLRARSPRTSRTPVRRTTRTPTGCLDRSTP